MTITLKNILIKTAGAGGLGLGIYDAHTRGKRTSIHYGKEQMADATLDAWLNSNRIDKESHVESLMKESAFKWRLDSPLPKIQGNIKGYVKGFFSSVAENVIPIGLSAGTFMAKGGSILQKIFAGGLGLYGLYAIIKAFTGIERNTKIR